MVSKVISSVTRRFDYFNDRSEQVHIVGLKGALGSGFDNSTPALAARKREKHTCYQFKIRMKEVGNEESENLIGDSPFCYNSHHQHGMFRSVLKRLRLKHEVPTNFDVGK